MHGGNMIFFFKKIHITFS